MSVCKLDVRPEHTHRESAAWLMENSWLINENVIEEIENLLKPRNALCLCEHHGPHTIPCVCVMCANTSVLAYFVCCDARALLLPWSSGCMMPFIQQLLMWSTGDMAVVFVIIILPALRNRKMVKCSMGFVPYVQTVVYSVAVAVYWVSLCEKVNMFNVSHLVYAVWLSSTLLSSNRFSVRFWWVCALCLPASLLAEWANAAAQHERDLFCPVHKLPKIILHLLQRTLNIYLFVVAIVFFFFLFSFTRSFSSGISRCSLACGLNWTARTLQMRQYHIW